MGKDRDENILCDFNEVQIILVWSNECERLTYLSGHGHSLGIFHILAKNIYRDKKRLRNILTTASLI